MPHAHEAGTKFYLSILSLVPALFPQTPICNLKGVVSLMQPLSPQNCEASIIHPETQAECSACGETFHNYWDALWRKTGTAVNNARGKSSLKEHGGDGDAQAIS